MQARARHAMTGACGPSGTAPARKGGVRLDGWSANGGRHQPVAACGDGPSQAVQPSCPSRVKVAGPQRGLMRLWLRSRALGTPFPQHKNKTKNHPGAVSLNTFSGSHASSFAHSANISIADRVCFFVGNVAPQPLPRSLTFIPSSRPRCPRSHSAS